jgi:uncharacterized membrane protein YsdA (DUF1294 family)
MKILFYYFLIVNTLAFAIIGYDKYLAKSNKRRIPENTLLSFVAFAGTIGVGIAMLFFRHKTAKASFLWKYFGIVLLQIIIGWLYFK